MESQLEAIHRRTEDGVRELGARILEMYHQGSVDVDAVREGAATLERLERSAAELEAELGARPEPRPRKARARPASASIRPVLGAEDRPVAEREAESSAEPGTNGERDERLQHAVETARRQAEERATAEIMALEEDLEREREHAAKSLEEVQRRLEDAEARAADSITVTDLRAREQAADWLREQRGDVRRELEA